jgi:Flp pilus assembly secretin CpaC
VGRIAVGNGSILTAAALDNREVILFANAVGTSSLFVWNEDGRYQRLKVSIVPGDTSRYAREISSFLAKMPGAKTSIIGDKVIVEGDALSDQDIAKIDELAKRYPQVVNFTNRLGWEQMILMDVKVVEFPVSELREIGIKWGATGGAGIGGIWAPGSQGNPNEYGLTIANGPVSAAVSGASLAYPAALKLLSAVNMGIGGQLNLLAQNGKLTVLAEPQLSARNGSKASFLAGGEFPYSVSSANGTTVMFKPYGIKLEITPRADRNGLVRATIESEVSNIDTSIATSAGPALSMRKTSTEFNVRSGETLVLSGLVSRKTSTTIDKVPGLGDIPILGALFRSTRFQNDETELVVFVTPTVVDSHSPGLVDRVKRTHEKLQDRLGTTPPYLSEPLQPNHDPAKSQDVQEPAPVTAAPIPAPAPAPAPGPAPAPAPAPIPEP